MNACTVCSAELGGAARRSASFFSSSSSSSCPFLLLLLLLLLLLPLVPVCCSIARQEMYLSTPKMQFARFLLSRDLTDEKCQSRICRMDLQARSSQTLLNSDRCDAIEKTCLDQPSPYQGAESVDRLSTTVVQHWGASLCRGRSAEGLRFFLRA